MAQSCHSQCQLVNDSVNGFLEPTTCGSAPTSLYQSYLETPPDGTFFALLNGTTCTVTFTFYQSHGRGVERSFTPGNEDVELAVALTVPDVRRITAACTGGQSSGSTCSFQWFFLPHYCRCCAG